MTVSELIAMLQQFPGDALVVTQDDYTGNYKQIDRQEFCRLDTNGPVAVVVISAD